MESRLPDAAFPDGQSIPIRTHAAVALRTGEVEKQAFFFTTISSTVITRRRASARIVRGLTTTGHRACHLLPAGTMIAAELMGSSMIANHTS